MVRPADCSPCLRPQLRFKLPFVKNSAILALALIACAPTVQGRALNLSGPAKRVAVAGKAYTSGVENALMSLAADKMTLLARTEQKAIGDEKELQYSGDFSDDHVVSIGKQLGAELLFVVKDDVQQREVKESPHLENCAFHYGDKLSDTPEQKELRKKDRAECDKRNEAETKRAAAVPPHITHSYKTNVRVVDVQSGQLMAFGEATVADGQAGLTCVYPCTRDKASELAVRAILGLPTE